MRIIISIIGLSFLLFSNNAVSASVSLHYQAVSEQLVASAEKSISEENLEKAMLFYKQAMVANPKNINAYLGLGSLHSDKGQYSLGIKYYDIALSIDPIDLLALEGRVLTNLKRRDLASAKQTFQTMQQVCEVIECTQLPSVAQAMEAYQLEEDSN